MTRLALVIALAAGFNTASAQPADAPPDKHEADKKAATERFESGQQHFRAGQYLPAAEDFEAAYALDPDPVYLYNTAQAYRNGSACARAADYYRRFLAVVPNPPNLDKVTRYLGELDACAKAESSETTVVPQSQDKPAPAVVPPPRPVAVDDPGSPRERHVGLAIGLGGIAVLAAGAWFTYDVHTLEGYSRAICSGAAPCSWSAAKQARADDLQHRGNRASALAIGSYAVGGAAVITGVALYVLGGRESRETAVTAVPLQGGGAIVARFAF